jgi:hypothetical protein
MVAERTSIGTADREHKLVTTPRAGAVAGMMFAILFSIALVIIRSTLNDLSASPSAASDVSTDPLSFALALVPFAGIFFLWFIAVVRQHLGRFEDQFFSTVFYGSGILFLAMVFVASGVAGGIVLGVTRHPDSYATTDTYSLARDLVGVIFTVYAMRMAAVFVLSQATLWLRTKVMPRWMAFISYAVALVLLFSFTRHTAVVIVFPAWVFLVSMYILLRGGAEARARRREAPSAPDEVARG